MRTLRPSAADQLLAAAAFVLGVVVALALDAVDSSDHERTVDGWSIALLAAMAVPLLVRRRRPISVLLVVLALSTPFHALDYPHEAAMPASLVAAFAAARYSQATRRAVVALVAATVVLVPIGTVGASAATVDALLGAAWIYLAFAVGLAIRFREEWRIAVAARLEQERADEVERRVAEEKVLIARELHDVLAHGLTVANVQASVAAHLIDQLPRESDTSLQELSTTLHHLSETSRATLHELRAVLDVLHGGDVEPAEPAPQLGELPRLVSMADAAGVRVDVELDGLPDELPSTVSVAAYRIVQESLTNVVRHSAAQHAVVRLALDGDRVRVSVADPGPARANATVPSAGFGIVGMRGRAQAVGGDLSAGPGRSGGFEVVACLPLPETWRVTS